MVRPYRSSDYDTLLEITTLAFDGVSIDQNIEELYGLVNGVDWQERKASHAEADVAASLTGIFVYDIDGEPVGFISCRFSPRTLIGWIPNFAVHPAHQGKGIGKQLMEAALTYLRTLGMKFVRIETLEQNTRCCALYPKLGFREIARQIHYVMPLDDARQDHRH